MKKSVLLKLSYIMYILLVVGMIITLFIVYKEVGNSFSYKFVIGYIIFLIVCFFYFTFITIANMRTLRWLEIRRRLVKFIASFILLCALKYISKYGFKLSDVDLWGDFSTPLGLSLGFVFYDLAFIRKKNT